MIKVGDKLPAGNLQEFIEVEGNGCSVGPNSFDIQKASSGKTIAIPDSSNSISVVVAPIRSRRSAE